LKTVSYFSLIDELSRPRSDTCSQRGSVIGGFLGHFLIFHFS
jgi:hypothetical protein